MNFMKDMNISNRLIGFLPFVFFNSINTCIFFGDPFRPPPIKHLNITTGETLSLHAQ